MKFATSGYFLFIYFFTFFDVFTMHSARTIIPLSRHNPEQVTILQNFFNQDIACMKPTLKSTIRSWIPKSGYRWLGAFDEQQNLMGVAVYGLCEKYCWLYLLAAEQSQNLEQCVHFFIPEIQKFSEGLPIHGYVQGFKKFAALSEHGFVAQQEFFIMKKTALKSMLENVFHRDPTSKAGMTGIPSNCCIRELDTNDRDMMQAYAALFKEEECSISWDFVSLQKYIKKHPDYHFLALYNQDNQLCAGLIYFLTDDGDYKIEVLSVDSDHRYKGYATTLLSFVQNWAVQQGIDTLVLSVLTTNTSARACYEKFGFCYNDMQYLCVAEAKIE